MADQTPRKRRTRQAGGKSAGAHAGARKALEAENARLRAARGTNRGWDCLNPPDPKLLADLPWLRSVVDAALAEPGEGGAP